MPHSPHAVMGLKYVTIIVSITYFVDFNGLQSREDHGRRGRGGGEMVNVVMLYQQVCAARIRKVFCRFINLNFGKCCGIRPKL